MPYIAVNTTKKLQQTQKEEIKSTLGEIITIIPNKTEKVTMVDISDEHTMYFGGNAMENCAYVDVRLYGTAPFSSKSQLTEKIYEMLNKIVGLKETEIYISYSEFNTWGTMGHLK